MVFDQAEFFILALIAFPIYLWQHRQKRLASFMFHSLFYVYLAGVISQTLFPITLDLELGLVNQSHHVETELFRYFVLRDALLNVLLTVPYGLLYPFISRHSWPKTFGRALLVPVVIESFQFLILLLTPNYPRVVDVSDIVFNFGGLVLGYLVYRIILGRKQRSE